LARPSSLLPAARCLLLTAEKKTRATVRAVDRVLRPRKAGGSQCGIDTLLVERDLALDSQSIHYTPRDSVATVDIRTPRKSCLTTEWAVLSHRRRCSPNSCPSEAPGCGMPEAIGSETSGLCLPKMQPPCQIRNGAGLDRLSRNPTASEKTTYVLFQHGGRVLHGLVSLTKQDNVAV